MFKMEKWKNGKNKLKLAFYLSYFKKTNKKNNCKRVY